MTDIPKFNVIEFCSTMADTKKLAGRKHACIVLLGLDPVAESQEAVLAAEGAAPTRVEILGCTSTHVPEVVTRELIAVGMLSDAQQRYFDKTELDTGAYGFLVNLCRACRNFTPIMKASRLGKALLAAHPDATFAHKENPDIKH